MYLFKAFRVKGGSPISRGRTPGARPHPHGHPGEGRGHSARPRRAFPPLRGARARSVPLAPAPRALPQPPRHVPALPSSAANGRRAARRRALYKGAAAAGVRQRLSGGLEWRVRLRGRGPIHRTASFFPAYGPSPVSLSRPGKAQVCARDGRREEVLVVPEAGGRLGRGGHVGAAQRLSGERCPPRRRAESGPAGRDSGAGGARRPGGRRVRAVPAELALSHRWASGSSGAVCPQKGCVCVSPPVCRPTSVPELYVFSNKLSALLLPPPPGLLLCGCWRLHVVTGECVYVLGPGGSVCISLRGATGSGVGWKSAKGLLGWAVSEAGEKD